MSQPVLAETANGVLQITLNRPDQLNAFTVEMHEHLRAALYRAAAEDDIRAVLITGAGRGFCAGQDLSERDPDSGDIVDLGKTLRSNYNPLIKSMRALEKPIVGAVNGVAAGAGANFALACDIVVAAESARFIQAFANIGLIPDAGGTFTLSRLVGETRAKALAMTGMPLGAAEAAQWGLIFKCFPDDQLMTEARSLAESLASGATLGMGKAKLAIQAAATNTMDEQLELEAVLQAELGASTDFREGVRAFLEKRPPKFTGK